MPITRRLPKKGFKNKFKAVYSVVNVGQLEVFEAGSVVTAELCKAAGLISKIEPYGLKVLGQGELSKALTVQAKKFTKSAAEIIEKAGGKAEVR